MRDIASEVVSIAEACLGGLQGRSALLIGPDELRHPYARLLRQARMKCVFQEDTSNRVVSILPSVQLVISMPAQAISLPAPALTAASIAEGCEGRRSPLLIFDLAQTPSVEDLAGLLPAVCLYTPDDLRGILAKREMKAS